MMPYIYIYKILFVFGLAVHWFLIAVASLVVGYGLLGTWAQ